MQFLNYLLYTLLSLTSLFLICLVLIQRGKGGGLAGAFGGVGGSSAFGTKAGDVFTRVTMITAGIWITLNMLLVVLSNHRDSAWGASPPASTGTSLPGGSKSSLEKVATDKVGSPADSIEGGTGKPAPKEPVGTKADANPLSPRSADLQGTPQRVEPVTPTPKP